MTNKRMWFYANGQHHSLKAPAYNAPTSPTGWNASGNYLSGGAWVRSSALRHMEYDFSWNLMEYEEVSKVLNLVDPTALQGYVDSDIPLRYNFATDPRALMLDAFTDNPNMVGWGTLPFSSADSTTTNITGASDGPEVASGRQLTSYVRQTWTTAASSTDGGFVLTQGGQGGGAPVSPNNGLKVLPNEVYEISYFIRHTTSTNPYLHADTRIIFRTASGAVVSFSTPSTAVQAGDWVRIVHRTTVPAGAYLLSASALSAGSLWSVGDRIEATGLLVEKKASLTEDTYDYFDGGTWTSPLDTYHWVNPIAANVGQSEAIRSANSLIYFHMPDRMGDNALPYGYSLPLLEAEAGMSLVYHAASVVNVSEEFSRVPVPAELRNAYGLPGQGVRLSISNAPGTYTPVGARRFYVPPGYKGLLDVWGCTGNVSTGYMRVDDRTLQLPVKGSAGLQPETITLLGAGLHELAYQLTGNGANDFLEVYGVQLRLVPETEPDSAPTRWVAGQGNSGCRYQTVPEVMTYSSVMGLYATKTKLIEVGAWERAYI